jgi:hypothetical protein
MKLQAEVSSFRPGCTYIHLGSGYLAIFWFFLAHLSRFSPNLTVGQVIIFARWLDSLWRIGNSLTALIMKSSILCAWLRFLPRLCCAATTRWSTHRRSFYCGLLSLPLSPCLETPMMIAHITWVALRRLTGWGVAFFTGRQCRKFLCWRTSPYLLPLLVDVEMMGLEGRRTYLDADSHQFATATN